MLNLRLPLAQLGQAAQIGSPSAAIEPAVASAWWTGGRRNPTCPVAIRHLLVRDAIYAGITVSQAPIAARPRGPGGQRAASWEHRVAALDRPDEDLAVELERAGRARRRRAGGWRWPPPTCSGPRTSPRPGPTGNGGC